MICLNIRKFILTFALGVTLTFTPTISEAYVFNDSQEHIFGEIIASEYEAYSHSWHNDYLNFIKDELISHNPSKLNANDGRHTRYLYPIKESAQQGLDALTIPSGRIYVTTQLIDFVFTIPSTGETDFRQQGIRNGINLYQRSMMGAILAHECSHWYNRDFQRKIDTLYGEEGMNKLIGTSHEATRDNLITIMTDIAQNKTASNTRFSVENEYLADKQAVEFINNCQQISVGSLISFLYRLQMNENKYVVEGVNDKHVVLKENYNPHPDTAERIRRLENQVSQMSNGRVVFSNKKFYLDGKLFMGTGTLRATNKGSSLDRTYYVAGEVANLIRENSFGRVRLRPINDNEDENNPNTTDYYLIYDSASSNRARVIDKVYLKPKEALYIRGELDTPNGYNFSDDAKLVKTIAYFK